MRFHSCIALSAIFLTALLTERSDGDLFDVSDSPEETPLSYTTDDSLWDLSQPTVATDLPQDDSSLALGCASSGPGDLMGKARTRRQDGTCPSPIFSEGMDEFNWERVVRGRIKLIQDKAMRDGIVLPFCPPPTLPLCCVGQPEYLGVEVYDCQLCMLIPRATIFPFFPHEYQANDCMLSGHDR